MNDVNLISQDIVRGIDAIAAFTGNSPRRTYNLAARGNLPGAFREGRNWALLKSVYAEELKARAKQRIYEKR